MFTNAYAISSYRKRMGISQHALNLIEGVSRKGGPAADSSEFEDKAKQRCKFQFKEIIFRKVLCLSLYS